MDGIAANLTHSSGTLTLSGANTYTGATYVTGGTLDYATGSSLLDAGNINVTGGGTLRVSGMITMAGATSFGIGSGLNGTTGAVEVASGGVLDIGADSGNTFIGGDYINATGSGRVGQAGTGVLTIDAGGTVNVEPAGSSGAGPGGLDASRLWLNPYGGTGATINLDGGTLATARPIGNGTGGSTAALNFDGGTLRAMADTSVDALGPLTVNIRNGGGTIDTNGYNLLVSVPLVHSTIDGDDATDGGLTKVGAGALTLATANTYNGGTVLSGGQLNINNSAALGTGPLTINDGTTLDNTSVGAVTLATNNPQNWNGDFTVGGTQPLNLGTGPVTLGGNRTITVNAGNFTVAGPIGEGAGGPFSLTKSGLGTLTLSGANTYSGGTTINPGGAVMVVNSNTALGAGPVTLAGGTLRLQANTTTGPSIGVHFGTDQGAGAYILAPGDVAGAGSFAMSHWNNAPNQSGATGDITGPMPGAIVDNSGNSTSSTITWTSSGPTFPATLPVNATADNRLMGSFTNISPTTISVSNIPYASYEVVAYVGNEGGGANGRNAHIVIGGTTYYYSTDSNDGNVPYQYIPIATTTNPGGTYPGGNYAVFTGLSGSSFTLTQTSESTNSGVMGIEILQTQSNPLTLANDSHALRRLDHRRDRRRHGHDRRQAHHRREHAQRDRRQHRHQRSLQSGVGLGRRCLAHRQCHLQCDE